MRRRLIGRRLNAQRCIDGATRHNLHKGRCKREKATIDAHRHLRLANLRLSGAICWKLWHLIASRRYARRWRRIDATFVRRRRRQIDEKFIWIGEFFVIMRSGGRRLTDAIDLRQTGSAGLRDTAWRSLI